MLVVGEDLGWHLRETIFGSAFWGHNRPILTNWAGSNLTEVMDPKLWEWVEKRVSLGIFSGCQSNFYQLDLNFSGHMQFWAQNLEITAPLVALLGSSDALVALHVYLFNDLSDILYGDR